MDKEIIAFFGMDPMCFVKRQTPCRHNDMQMRVLCHVLQYLPEFDKYFFQRLKWREDLAKECKQITTFGVKETIINNRVSLRRESTQKCLSRVR